MNFKATMKNAERMVTRNSPNILTALGVAGLVGTAYLTARAAYKHAQIMGEESPSLTPREEFEKVWKLYIPAVAVGVTSAGCIIGSNRIGTRRTAAMAAAYTLSERAAAEYRDKVVEKFGEKKEQEVRDAVAADAAQRSERQVPIVMDQNMVWTMDNFTKREFPCTMEALKKAQNDFNYRMLHEGWGSLNEFYDFLGQPHSQIGESLGWSADHLLELNFSATLGSHSTPMLVFDYHDKPRADFDSYR